MKKETHAWPCRGADKQLRTTIRQFIAELKEKRDEEVTTGSPAKPTRNAEKDYDKPNLLEVGCLIIIYSRSVSNGHKGICASAFHLFFVPIAGQRLVPNSEGYRRV